VRTSPVVVGDVLLQRLLQRPSPEDQQPVQAFSAHRPHPALSDCVRAGRSDRSPHHARTCSAEHRVEGGGELRPSSWAVVSRWRVDEARAEPSSSTHPSAR
jgi:hypothetical protein